MYYRSKSVEEVPLENISIWSCTKDNCKGWMRDNFAFERAPVCRLCESPMESGTKMLPLLVNPNGDLKAIKKGMQIR